MVEVYIVLEMILPKISISGILLKGDCAFSIIDVRLFSLIAREIGSRSEIDLSLALLTIENNGND
jgi:hypothetical protein